VRVAVGAANNFSAVPSMPRRGAGALAKGSQPHLTVGTHAASAVRQRADRHDHTMRCYRRTYERTDNTGAVDRASASTEFC
jgi:hypothetical protein